MISLAPSGSGFDEVNTKRTLARANEALRAGDRSGAEQALRARLCQCPNDVHVLAKLGSVLAEQGQPAEAIPVYRRALAVAPNADPIRIALAQALRCNLQLGAALDEIERLDAPSSSSFVACTLEAALLGEIGLHERELEAYARLLAAHPRDAILWVNYGNALKTCGRTGEAIRALRRAISSRPSFGAAYWSLANLKTFRFDDRDIAAMRRALRRNLTEADVMHLHFALGKALEDRGEIERSFQHYVLGNQIRAAKLNPEQMDVTARVTAAIRTFTPEFFEDRGGTGCTAPDPIFIVGLHRSGSTLVEQILASHPLIEGVAELQVLDQLWFGLGRSAGCDPFDALKTLSRKALDDLGAEYIERTRAFRHTDRPFFIDKQAANVLNVGLIRLILPNAKIIDTRRHPMAWGFSNFRQYYDTGVLFAYNLESIGRCYANYLRLMIHFDEVLPGAVHRVLNEQLIDDQQKEIRRLLQYVGVPFDNACLESHKTERPVHSASSEQVRRPINRDGVASWRRFEPWLSPLKDALGDSLENWDRQSS